VVLVKENVFYRSKFEFYFSKQETNF